MVQQVVKLFALLCIVAGISYMVFAITAFTGIGISMITDKEIYLVEIMKESVIINILAFLSGCFVLLLGVNILTKGTEKIALDVNIDYEVIEIETNDSQSTVKLLLKDNETGDMVLVERETKHLAYFKEYFESSGNRMLGSLAETI